MPSQLFDKIIADFGRLLGIEDMVPEQDCICQLEFPGQQILQITYMGARNMLLISCPLDCRHPDPSQLEVMARSNFLQAASGAVACLAPDKQVHLQFGLDLKGSSAESLLAAAEALLAEAAKWQQLLDGRNTGHVQRDPAFFLGQSV